MPICSVCGDDMPRTMLNERGKCRNIDGCDENRKRRYPKPKETLEMSKPKIVAIIGSSRFKAFQLGHAQRLTLQGKIVLVTGFWHHVDNYPITFSQKEDLDELTRAKVSLADEIFVVNVNGYIGESTKRAIAEAETLDKTVTYAEPIE